MQPVQRRRAHTQKTHFQKLDRVRSEASRQRVRHRRWHPSSEDATQEVDKVCDRGWSALRARLYAYRFCPRISIPKPSARQNTRTAFPWDCRLPAHLRRATCGDGLATTANRQGQTRKRAGGALWAGVSRQRQSYSPGIARWCRGLARGADTPNLSVHLKQLSVAIAEYANKVAASVDRDDAESVRLAVAALAPIDRYREASLRRSSGPASPADPMPDPLPLGDDPASPAVT